MNNNYENEKIEDQDLDSLDPVVLDLEEIASSGKTAKDRALDILFAICVLVVLGTGVYLSIYLYGVMHSNKIVNELKELMDETEESADDEVEYASVWTGLDYRNIEIIKKMQAIYAKNNDFIGWLTIDDTRIDYPVMYTPEDGQYYLHLNFEKKYSSGGCLFIDENCIPVGDNKSDNIIIYGHNMKAGTMFHDLLKYADEDFYSEHKYIYFDTIEGYGTYEVIAAFYTQFYDNPTGNQYNVYNFVKATNKADFDAYIQNAISKTSYNVETTAEYGDQLITLSTCSYHTTNGRFVVVAKKIE